MAPAAFAGIGPEAFPSKAVSEDTAVLEAFDVGVNVTRFAGSAAGPVDSAATGAGCASGSAVPCSAEERRAVLSSPGAGLRPAAVSGVAPAAGPSGFCFDGSSLWFVACCRPAIKAWGALTLPVATPFVVAVFWDPPAVTVPESLPFAPSGCNRLSSSCAGAAPAPGAGPCGDLTAFEFEASAGSLGAGCSLTAWTTPEK